MSASTKIVGLSTAAGGIANASRYEYTPGVALSNTDSFIVAALVRVNGMGVPDVDSPTAVIVHQSNPADANEGWSLSVASTAQLQPEAGVNAGSYLTFAFTLGDGASINTADVSVPLVSVLGRWIVVYGYYDGGNGNACRVGVNGSLFVGEAAAPYTPYVGPLQVLNLAGASTYPCAKNLVSVASVGIKTFTNTTSARVTANIASMVAETMANHYFLQAESDNYTLSPNVFIGGFNYLWNLGAEASTTVAPETVSNSGTGAAGAILTRVGDPEDFTRSVSDVAYAAGASYIQNPVP